MSKTLYLESTQLFAGVWRSSEDTPASADETTSIVMASPQAFQNDAFQDDAFRPAGDYFSFVPGITDSVVYSTSFIEGDANGAHGWRSKKAYSGVFDSGNWTISFKLKNRAAYAHAGRVYARIYHTYANDPLVSELTRLNSVDAYSSIITFPATAGNIQTGTITVNCDQNLTLGGECVFVVLNWKITTAGGNANAGVKFMVNEGSAEKIDTTSFTSNAGMTQPLSAASISTGGFADARFCSLMGAVAWSATEFNQSPPIPTGGTLGGTTTSKQAMVELITDPGAGTSVSFTLYVNGAPTSVVLTVANTATTAIDATHTADVVAGDYVSWKCAVTGAVTVSHTMIAIGFTGSTAGESILLGTTSANALSLSATEYAPLATGISNPGTTEAIFNQILPTPGTFKKLYWRLSVDPGTSPDAYSLTLRVSGVDTALTSTITANATTGNDTANTTAELAGEDVKLTITPLNTPSATPTANWGLVFVADTNGESLILGGTDNVLNNAADEFNLLAAAGATATQWTATEAQAVAILNACTLKKLYVELDIDPGTSPDAYSFTLREEGASSTLTCTIVANNITGNDTANTVTIEAGNTVSLMSHYISTPSATPYAVWGMVAYVSPSTTWNETLTDGLKVGDPTVTAKLTINVSLTDGLKPGDSSLAPFITNYTLTDGAKFGDLTNIYKLFEESLGEGFKLGDLSSVQINFNPTATDGFKLGETLSTLCSFVNSATDGLKVGDIPTTQANLNNLLTDGLKVGDTPSFFLTFNRSLSDGFKVGDSASHILTLNLSLTDGMKMGDKAVVLYLLLLILSSIAGQFVVTSSIATQFNITSKITQQWDVTSSIQ